MNEDLIKIIFAFILFVIPFIILAKISNGAEKDFDEFIRALRTELRKGKNLKATKLKINDTLETFLIYLVISIFKTMSVFWTIVKVIVALPGYLLFMILRQKIFINFKFKFDLFKSFEKMIDEFASIIENGDEICASYGEMGHKIFQSDIICDALIEANKRGAKIVFSAGPRVDPKTTKIFKLARDGVLDIIRSKDYYHNHFAIVKTKDDECYVIDEQVHDQVYWNSNKGVPFYENKTRVIYIYKNRLKVWNKKFEIFNERISGNKKISNHPRLKAPQHLSILKTIWEFFWYNIMVGNIIQPISIVLGIPMDIIYK